MSTEIAQALEAVADATVGARRFLARVKPRTLKTDAGRVVTTTEIAEALVKRADLEHAVLPGKRPKYIACKHCGVRRSVPTKGPVPSVCRRCSNNHGYRPGLDRCIKCADCGTNFQGRTATQCKKCRDRRKLKAWRSRNRERVRESSRLRERRRSRTYKAAKQKRWRDNNIEHARNKERERRAKKKGAAA